jgi:hypothetical protein
MGLKLNIINPLDIDNWDDLVLSNPDYSFFHSKAWARVVCDSYQYKPFYCILIKGHVLEVLIPLMEVRSIITGRRAISLPFTDHCEPIISNGISSADVLDQIINYGKKSGWKYFELRPEKRMFNGLTATEKYIGHVLHLNEDEKKVFSEFRNSTKRNIKKAEKNGVEVCLLNSLESVGEFYRLNCITRKRHGIPPQPYSFFINVHKHVISKNQGFVALASYKNKVIAAAVFFNFGKKAMYKYGASDLTFQELRANNLVMWSAIKWYSENGFTELDMGKTRIVNKGLLQFKEGWGARRQEIQYYKIWMTEKTANLNNTGLRSSVEKLISKMPLCVLKIVGRIAYKHIA